MSESGEHRDAQQFMRARCSALAVGVILGASIVYVGARAEIETSAQVSETTIPVTNPSYEILPPVSIGGAPTITAAPLETGCIQPTPEDQQAVKDLLAAPSHPAILLSGGGKDSFDQEAYDAHQAYKAQLALDKNQVVINGDDVLTRLNQDRVFTDTGMTRSATDYYLGEAQSFMSRFGVTVSVGEPDKIYSPTTKGPSQEDIDGDIAKNALTDIVGAFSGQTMEYVSTIAGVTHIELVSIPPSEDVAGYVQADSPGTIFININKDLQSSIGAGGIGHEVYHLVDQKQCHGDISNDPSFWKMNGPISVYNGVRHDPSIPNLNSYYSSLAELGDEYSAAQNSGDMDMLCRLSAVEDNMAGQVATMTDYHPNAGEDKAELGELLSNPSAYNEVVDPRFRILSTKFSYLLSRLYHQSPQLVEYFVGLSSDPYITSEKLAC